MSESDKPCHTLIVNAPAGSANAELNGARVMPLRALYVGVAEFMIVSGPYSGRRWQFRSKDLQEVAHG